MIFVNILQSDIFCLTTKQINDNIILRCISMLNKNDFVILTEIEKKNNINTKELSCKVRLPIEELNTKIKELSEKGLIANNNITEKGLEALEPYRVKRAIFIAAGMGTRMLPITINTPKPLVRVNGTRIIDTLIDSCINVGIEEIIVVRGYLKEVFDQLKYKYPNIQFIDNPKYSAYNNISSAYLVKDKIGGSYIFESDIYLVNKDLITKYQYKSNYLGVSVERTEDWCFDTNENKRITDLHKGGRNCYHMFGIAYYDEQTGKLFAKKVESIFHNTPGGTDCFYDDVLCHFYPDEAEIYVRKCTFEDTAEIDTFKDLCKIDERYAIES